MIIFVYFYLFIFFFFFFFFIQASDLDSIIQLHEDYVNQIHDRCLLNKKVCGVHCQYFCLHVPVSIPKIVPQAQIVKEAITRTLKLTITMYNNWARGAKHFRSIVYLTELCTCILSL